jgi:malate dehydrogenase
VPTDAIRIPPGSRADGSPAVCSAGACGIKPGLTYSFPVRCDRRTWSVVRGVPVNASSRARLAATEQELKEGRSLIAELLPE